MDFCLEKLAGKKRIDLFELSRVSREVPHEEQLKTLAALSAEGKFDYIGLSEVSAKTIREAASVIILCPVNVLD